MGATVCGRIIWCFGDIRHISTEHHIQVGNLHYDRDFNAWIRERCRKWCLQNKWQGTQTSNHIQVTNVYMQCCLMSFAKHLDCFQLWLIIVKVIKELQYECWCVKLQTWRRRALRETSLYRLCISTTFHMDLKQTFAFKFKIEKLKLQKAYYTRGMRATFQPRTCCVSDTWKLKVNIVYVIN